MKNRIVKISISVIVTVMMAMSVIAPCPSAVSAVARPEMHLSGSAYALPAKPAKKKYNTYRGRNATKIPVLAYHQIMSDERKHSSDNWNDRYIISTTNFEKQMKWLKKKHYRTISCEELYLWRKGEIRLPRRSVLITMDDGYSEGVENAYAILSKYGFKATVFVIGKYAIYGAPAKISYQRIRELQEIYPKLEFQSHTYDLHAGPYEYMNYTYDTIMQDAVQQRGLFGFDYLAYPYGKQKEEIINAYRDSGIKMAFLFGKNGYATRKQNIYKMKRIEVTGDMKYKRFKAWCK